MASVALLHGNPGAPRPAASLRLSGTFYPCRPMGAAAMGVFIPDSGTLAGVPLPVAIPVDRLPAGWSYPEPVQALNGFSMGKAFNRAFKFQPLKLNVNLGGLSRLQPLRPLGALGRGIERVGRTAFDAAFSVLNVGLGAVGAVAQVLPGSQPMAAARNVPQGQAAGADGAGYAPPPAPVTETLPPPPPPEAYRDPFGADPYADPSYYSEAA